MLHVFFALFSSHLDRIMLILHSFEELFTPAQVSSPSCPWPLKLMTSLGVEGMWICTGGYRQFRGNWVKEVYGGDMSGKFECRYWGSFIHYFFTNQWFLSKTGSEGVVNGTSKNVGLGKFWQDLKISEAFLISLEVSFFHGLLLLFLSLETFHQRVSSSDF